MSAPRCGARCPDHYNEMGDDATCGREPGHGGRHRHVNRARTYDWSEPVRCAEGWTWTLDSTPTERTA